MQLLCCNSCQQGTGLAKVARSLLDQARSFHSLSLVWTKAHTKKNSTVANKNRKADSLALPGRRKLARCCSIASCIGFLQDYGSKECSGRLCNAL